MRTSRPQNAARKCGSLAALPLALLVVAACTEAPTTVEADSIRWLLTSVSPTEDCGAELGACIAEAAQAHQACVGQARAELTGPVRADAIQICNAFFADARVQCESLGSCESSCQATYDANAASCIANNDPSVCGGDPLCESDVLNNQADCLANSQTILDTCLEGCAATEPWGWVPLIAASSSPPHTYV